MISRKMTTKKFVQKQENTTKMQSWKITTAKFKCTREHILGHDWLPKNTWDLKAHETGEFFHVYIINK